MSEIATAVPTPPAAGFELPVKTGHSSLSVAQYIIDLCARSGINSSLTPMQVLKLVYLAHGWMLGIHGRPLVSDDIEAWTYGPVIPVLYEAIRRYRSGPVASVEGAVPLSLDQAEQDVIAQVCDIYGRRTGMELSQLTHQEGSPWDQVWSILGKSGRMSNDIIEQHYRSLAQSPG